MKWQKRTDSELFKELRINCIILAFIFIAIAVIGFFTDILEEVFYTFMIFVGGLLLLSYSFQKYFQEHSKARIIIMCVLLGLLVLGVVLFLIFNK